MRDKINAFLKLKGINYKDICNELNIPFQSVGNFLEGRTKRMNKHRYLRMIIKKLNRSGASIDFKPEKHLNRKELLHSKMNEGIYYSQSDLRELTGYPEGTIRKSLLDLTKEGKVMRVDRDRYILSLKEVVIEDY